MTQNTAPASTRMGLSANMLKWIAIVAMTIDHIAWLFVADASPLGIAMHTVGRITGPTMFFLVSEGYHHTRNAGRYTLRLAVFAVVSYLPFFYFNWGMLPSINNYTPFPVIYTLLCALLALRARHEIENIWVRRLAIICLVLLTLPADWPVIGVGITLVFDYYRGRFRKAAVAYAVLVTAFMSMDIIYLATVGNIAQLMLSLFMLLGMMIPLFLLAHYNGQKGQGGRFSQWFFYIYYPLHLLVLGLLAYKPQF